MNNNQIIIAEAIAHGIYTEDQIEEFILDGRMVPLHTLQEWKSRGFNVKRGEKACLKCKLWRHTQNKKERSAGDSDNEVSPHYYMTTAHLFAERQVEKIEEESVNGKEL